MSLQFGTVRSVSAPRIRKPQPPRPPLTTQQREEKHRVHEEREARINDKVQEWASYTLNLAEDLGEEFDKKPRYFLDLFFQNGAKLVRSKAKVNAFNAFKSMKAEQINSNADAVPGNATDLMEIQKDFFEEYEQLSHEERQEIVENFKLTRDEHIKMKHPSARGCIQCISNAVQNMQRIIMSLKLQVGVEAFFCIVRNSSEVFVKPQWFFTTPELEEYMAIATRPSWITEQVGAKIEAFAVAGCDVAMLCRNSKQKAQYLKTEIRMLIKDALVEACGDEKATMNYIHYEEEVVHRYGVVMEGWTADKFVNPSELSSSLPLLGKLRDALKNGDCHFRKLSVTEKGQRIKDYNDKVAKGEIARWERERRSDLGTKRKQKVPSSSKNGQNAASVQEIIQSDPEEVDGPPPRTPSPSEPRRLPAPPLNPPTQPSRSATPPAHPPSVPRQPLIQSEVSPIVSNTIPNVQMPTVPENVGGKRKRQPPKVVHLGFIDPSQKKRRRLGGAGNENRNPLTGDD